MSPDPFQAGEPEDPDDVLDTDPRWGLPRGDPDHPRTDFYRERDKQDPDSA